MGYWPFSCFDNLSIMQGTLALPLSDKKLRHLVCMLLCYGTDNSVLPFAMPAVPLASVAMKLIKLVSDSPEIVNILTGGCHLDC